MARLQTERGRCDGGARPAQARRICASLAKGGNAMRPEAREVGVANPRATWDLKRLARGQGEPLGPMCWQGTLKLRRGRTGHDGALRGVEKRVDAIKGAREQWNVGIGHAADPTACGGPGFTP